MLNNLNRRGKLFRTVWDLVSSQSYNLWQIPKPQGKKQNFTPIVTQRRMFSKEDKRMTSTLLSYVSVDLFCYFVWKYLRRFRSVDSTIPESDQHETIAPVAVLVLSNSRCDAEGLTHKVFVDHKVTSCHSLEEQYGHNEHPLWFCMSTWLHDRESHKHPTTKKQGWYKHWAPTGTLFNLTW